MQEMQFAIEAVTSPAVQVWMNWMLMVFMLSILFVWKHKSARYVLGAFFISALLGVLTFRLTGEPYLLGIPHILLWVPLAYYLYKHELIKESFKFASVYGVWITLLMATIAISVVLDIRDIALVLTNQK